MKNCRWFWGPAMRWRGIPISLFLQIEVRHVDEDLNSKFCWACWPNLFGELTHLYEDDTGITMILLSYSLNVSYVFDTSYLCNMPVSKTSIIAKQECFCLTTAYNLGAQPYVFEPHGIISNIWEAHFYFWPFHVPVAKFHSRIICE